MDAECQEMLRVVFNRNRNMISEMVDLLFKWHGNSDTFRKKINGRHVVSIKDCYELHSEVAMIDGKYFTERSIEENKIIRNLIDENKIMQNLIKDLREELTTHIEMEMDKERDVIKIL